MTPSQDPPQTEQHRPNDDHGEPGPECPACEGRVRREDIEWVCQACGLVVDVEAIDHGPEWRRFDDEDAGPTRVGSPRTETLHDRGLGTRISSGDTDAYGKPVPAQKRRRLSRLRRLDRQAEARTTREQTLRASCSEIARIVGRLELPTSVHERACRYARQASDADLFSGRSIETISAAAVFAACRTTGTVRQAAEVASVALADEDQIWHCYQVLNVEFGLAAALITPTAVVGRIASTLELDAAPRHRAVRYARLVEAHETEFGGASPSSLAAACTYLAIDEAERGSGATEPWQRRVAEAADVTTTTIRTHMDRIEELVETADQPADGGTAPTSDAPAPTD